MLAEDCLTGVPLLVLANKQDLKGALSVSDVAQKLDLTRLRGRDWHIQGTNATTGDGLYEGLDWLSNKLCERK